MSVEVPTPPALPRASTAPPPADAAPGVTEVHFVTTDAGLDALRPGWERCLEESPEGSIFVSFDWQRAWWKHYGAGRALRIAVARRSGRVTGVLPLYVGEAPVGPGVTARVLRLLGSGADTSPDYLGPVVAPEGGQATLAALCRAAVRSAGWDALELTDVLEGSPFVAEMEAACREAGTAATRTQGWGIYVARLPASWPEFVAGLSKDARAKNVRRPRKLWDAAGGRFFTWGGEPPLDAVVDRLAELHRLRWEGRAERHAFASAAYLGFHREVMHRLAALGRLRLYCVALGDAIVGVYYCYAFKGEISHFQVGYDPRYQELSPGHALMSFAVEQAIAEGATVFDMLKGEYPHKKAWANGRRTTVGLRAYRPTLRGSGLRLRRALLALVRARGRPPAPRGAGAAE